MRVTLKSGAIPLLAAVASLAIGGCGGDASESAELQSGPSDPSAAAITSADMDAFRSAFLDAVLAGDFAGAAAMYTPDAVYHHQDGTKSRGRTEIEQYLAASFGGVTMSDATLTPNDMGGGAGVAWETGELSATMTPEDGEPMPLSSNYLVVVERQADGRVLLVQDAEWMAPEQGGDEGGM